jgi:hypothetical protein
MKALCLHAGAKIVSETQLAREKAPKQTDTHHPIRHIELVHLVEENLASINLKVTGREFGVTPNGNKFFGLLQVKNGVAHDDYSWAIGLRNSHDKSMKAGICVGSHVFVCDNMCFSADVVMFRTHTNQIEQDLGSRVKEMLGRLPAMFAAHDADIKALKRFELDRAQARDLVVESAVQGLINEQSVVPVVKLWDTPPHAEFKPRNAWTLLNAYTEQDKALGPVNIAQRTGRVLQFLRNAINN